MAKVRWVVVVFGKGKRRTIPLENPKAGVAAVKKLRAAGLKAHLVSYNHATWPREDDEMLDAARGMTWCPYCRAWRWFSPPRYKHEAEFMSERWFLNIFQGQSIAICQWCWTSEQDWYVKQMNGLFDRDISKPKKRRR